MGAFCLLLGVLVSATPAALLQDPPPPPGGFDPVFVTDQRVDLRDGTHTVADVGFPNTTAPTGGWPVVIVVHAMGQERTTPFVVDVTTYLVRNGYCTLAHDVRGQGAAVDYGGTAVGEAERLDLAELALWLEQHFGSEADTDRLGVLGFSQGGSMAWGAAALSELELPPNNRGIARFPRIGAAVSFVGPPLAPATFLPQGNAIVPLMVQAFHSDVILDARGQPALRWETSFQQTVRALLEAEDFDALADFWSDFWRDDASRLPISRVPVLTQASFQDALAPVDPSLAAVAALGSDLPRVRPARVFLTTPGHSDVVHRRSVERRRLQAERWFDRFLKGEQNRIDREPTFTYSELPLRVDEYRDDEALLWTRTEASWPPSDVSWMRLYLRANAMLSEEPPSTQELPESVVHDVRAGSMRMLLDSGADFSLIEQWMETSTHTYDSPPLDEGEIVGSPRVVLEVTPDGPNYQLHCDLFAVSPRGEERLLQSAPALVRGDARSRRLEVDGHDLAARIAAGERLRLRIQSIGWFTTAGGGKRGLRVVPYFDSVRTEVLHTPLRLSYVELPFRNTIRPALSLEHDPLERDVLDFDTTDPLDLSFRLEGPASLSHAPYRMFFGFSGIAPGVELPGGERVLLQPDVWTTRLTESRFPALLPNTRGRLDGGARAQPAPQMRLSLHPDATLLVGLRTAAVALIHGPHGFVASNPVEWHYR